MTSTDGCYCGLAEKETSMLRCDACKKFFHRSCLKSGPPSPLEGDIFFQFVCSRCSSNGDEEVERMKLQWLQVVMLSLYNLQLSGMGKYGYFRWKEHICAFIDSHWTTFFGFSRKKTSLWHGTVAGTLSTGCPGYFLSGGEELNEPGWWRLAEMKPPSLKLEPPGRHCRKQKVEKEQPIKVESLRSRRGKTSIQAAIELKVKRSTLTEAKEIRKSRGAGRNWESSFNSEDRSMSNDCLTPSPQSGVKGHSEGDRKFAAVTASAGSSSQVAVKVEPMDDVAMETDSPTETGHSYASLPHSSSRGDLEEDTSSQLSHASSKTDVYLTEKDLWAVGTVPQYLLKDDEEDENDSDLEIDPGTFSPPRTDSPIVMSQSPTLQDIYASIHDSSGQTDNTDLSTDDKTFHPVKIKEEDAESELSSSSEESRAVTDSTDNSERRTQDKNKLKDDFSVDKEPEIKFITMSQYEESELLRRLQQATGVSTLEPDLARLRRKLIVRQLQRQHGQRVFNLDLEVRRSLGQLQHLDSKQLDWHHLNPDRLPMSRSSTTEVRVLDRFQVPHYQRRLLQAGPSSFLTRLLGTEDHQLQPISSPYTARTLKPFIRRDYESRPLKLRLLEEIRAFPHRKTADWTAPGGYPIDYCYVRPEHIPSVNTLCRQFFWPGIDLSECLQYPDFSCVVLYRKVVIGFAFMVPDTKYNEAYISFIFSHPEWRRCGIATFMLYHLIQTCMGKDVTLHVSVTNSAMLLYQKFGFKPEEFILDFYDKYYPVESDVCKHAFLLRLQR